MKDVLPDILLLSVLQEVCFCFIFPEAPPHLLCLLIGLFSFLDQCLDVKCVSIKTCIMSISGLQGNPRESKGHSFEKH